MSTRRISVARDFSETPGPRYIVEGEFSGELFRNQVLRPAVELCLREGHTLQVDLDGTAGYATSFLEESFGGLIRTDGVDYSKLQSRLEIISTEETYLVGDVEAYMTDAWKAKTH